MYLIQIDGAQNFSRMWTCIDFLFQRLKQNNPHVLFSCSDGDQEAD